jgi:glutathione S-transferase
MLTFVDVATARHASGVRIVVSGLVPSPWSEATKGLFRLAGVPVLAVRRLRDNVELEMWTGVDNVPVVFCDLAPPRTHFAAIAELAARLAGPDVLLPSALAARVENIGLLDLIAGEDGVGWNARLAMIEASFATDGARGFPLPVAKYLAARYGYLPAASADLRARVAAQLAFIDDRLDAREYLAGARPGAVDVYLATFLTPYTDITEADCPGLEPVLRKAFAAAHEELGALVPAPLLSHRTRMFERHLAYPIVL